MDIFQKKMTLIAYLFPRLRPTKSVITYMCKKSSLRLPLKKEHGKRVPSLLKSERQHQRHIYYSMGRQSSCKKSLLVISESLSLFLKTMNAVGKCSLPNRDNLLEPFHMQLSQKLKTLCSFILHFRNLV